MLPGSFSPSLRSPVGDQEPVPLFFPAPPVVTIVMMMMLIIIISIIISISISIIILAVAGDPRETESKSKKNKTHSAGLKIMTNLKMLKSLNWSQGGRGGEKDDREITTGPGSTNKGAEKPKREFAA